MTLLGKLNSILAEHATKRVNGKVASHGTTTAIGEALRTSFSNLHGDLGYRIQDPRNLTEKHLCALCEYWYRNELANSTIQRRLSALRIFCGWIGKGGMVKSLPTYLPNVDPKLLKVRKVADRSKSWTENGIDVRAKITEADALDPVFGRMLRMCLAFGLRRMEVIQLKPWKSDLGSCLRVYDAKNGRQRNIDIATHEQRLVLDLVKTHAGSRSKTEHMGWKATERGREATLAYSIGRYNRSMAKIGITRENAMVTGHGLRAQFAENAAIIAGMIPPTLGGTGGQMAKDDLDVTRAQVSELLGHSRISITHSYYGSFGRNVKPDEANRCRTNIEIGIALLVGEDLKPVPPNRMQDCVKLVGELAALEVEVTVKQVQVLWEIHSARHALEWIVPATGNAEAIEVAATKLAAKAYPRPNPRTEGTAATAKRLPRTLVAMLKQPSLFQDERVFDEHSVSSSKPPM